MLLRVVAFVGTAVGISSHVKSRVILQCLELCIILYSTSKYAPLTKLI